MQDFYPTELSDEEAAAGFVVAKIDNSSGHYRTQPSTMDAVVRLLSEGQRLVKMQDGESIDYVHQAFLGKSWQVVGLRPLTFIEAARCTALSDHAIAGSPAGRLRSLKERM